MEKFDDIPISMLNKAEGYQNDIKSEPKDQISEQNNDDIEDNLSILDKIEHKDWRIR